MSLVDSVRRTIVPIHKEGYVFIAIGVVAIEERLGVKLSERELFESKTVGDLEDLIRSKAGTPA